MAVIDPKALIVAQRLMRNVLVVYFGVVAGLILTGHLLAVQAAGWGIVLLLAATAIRVITLTGLFYKARLKLPTLLALLLLLLLISTVFLRYIQL